MLENDLRAAHKEEMNQVTTTHVSETKILNNEFLNIKTMYEHEHKNLLMKYNELEMKFQTRESRPEDLETIKKLKEAMVRRFLYFVFCCCCCCCSTFYFWCTLKLISSLSLFSLSHTHTQISKDEEIKRVREEMRYFKLELLNREENFNSKFGARPNVGKKF